MGSIRKTLALGAAGALLATAGLASTAVADDVIATNDDFIVGAVRTLDVVVDSKATILMNYMPTGGDFVGDNANGNGNNNGCNLTGAQMVLAVSAIQADEDAPVLFAPALGSFTMGPGCGDKSFEVTPTSTGTVTLVFSIASIGSNAKTRAFEDYDVTEMSFTLNVGDPEPEIVDEDHDTVPDDQDNCPGVANTDQADVDGDDVGDLCDSNSYAPVVEIQAENAIGDEGDTLATSGAFSDADGNETLNLTVTAPVDARGTFRDNGDGSFNWSLDTDDEIAGSVTVTADDGEHATVSQTFAYEAFNVAPTVAASANPTAACTASLDGTFTDPGTADTHTAVINWGDGTEDTAVDPATSPIGASHTYKTNGTFEATVTVADNDGGVGFDSANFATKVTPSAILQPINTTGARSEFKLGSTIPVKIRVTGCDGANVSGLAPAVSLMTISTPDGDGNVTETTVTAPATNGLAMRWSSTDLQYIYNLSTKAAQTQNNTPLTPGSYRVRVSDDSFFANPTADFNIKK